MPMELRVAAVGVIGTSMFEGLSWVGDPMAVERRVAGGVVFLGAKS